MHTVEPTSRRETIFACVAIMLCAVVLGIPYFLKADKEAEKKQKGGAIERSLFTRDQPIVQSELSDDDDTDHRQPIKIVHEIRWDFGQPLFEEDSPTEGRLTVRMGDKLVFKCPHDPRPKSEARWTYLKIYMVSDEEYDQCYVNKGAGKMVAACLDPQEPLAFTVAVEPHGRIPPHAAFEAGADHYFISTSSGTFRGVNLLEGGLCQFRNQRIVVHVKAEPEKSTADGKDGDDVTVDEYDSKAVASDDAFWQQQLEDSHGLGFNNTTAFDVHSQNIEHALWLLSTPRSLALLYLALIGFGLFANFSFVYLMRAHLNSRHGSLQFPHTMGILLTILSLVDIVALINLIALSLYVGARTWHFGLTLCRSFWFLSELQFVIPPLILAAVVVLYYISMGSSILLTCCLPSNLVLSVGFGCLVLGSTLGIPQLYPDVFLLTLLKEDVDVTMTNKSAQELTLSTMCARSELDLDINGDLLDILFAVFYRFYALLVPGLLCGIILLVLTPNIPQFVVIEKGEGKYSFALWMLTKAITKLVIFYYIYSAIYWLLAVIAFVAKPYLPNLYMVHANYILKATYHIVAPTFYGYVLRRLRKCKTGAIKKAKSRRVYFGSDEEERKRLLAKGQERYNAYILQYHISLQQPQLEKLRKISNAQEATIASRLKSKLPLIGGKQEPKQQVLGTEALLAEVLKRAGATGLAVSGHTRSAARLMSVSEEGRSRFGSTISSSIQLHRTTRVGSVPNLMMHKVSVSTTDVDLEKECDEAFDQGTSKNEDTNVATSGESLDRSDSGLPTAVTTAEVEVVSSKEQYQGKEKAKRLTSSGDNNIATSCDATVKKQQPEEMNVDEYLQQLRNASHPVLNRQDVQQKLATLTAAATTTTTTNNANVSTVAAPASSSLSTPSHPGMTPISPESAESIPLPHVLINPTDSSDAAGAKKNDTHASSFDRNRPETVADDLREMTVDEYLQQLRNASYPVLSRRDVQQKLATLNSIASATASELRGMPIVNASNSQSHNNSSRPIQRMRSGQRLKQPIRKDSNLTNDSRRNPNPVPAMRLYLPETQQQYSDVSLHSSPLLKTEITVAKPVLPVKPIQMIRVVNGDVFLEGSTELTHVSSVDATTDDPSQSKHSETSPSMSRDRVLNGQNQHHIMICGIDTESTALLSKPPTLDGALVQQNLANGSVSSLADQPIKLKHIGSDQTAAVPGPSTGNASNGLPSSTGSVPRPTSRKPFVVPRGLENGTITQGPGPRGPVKCEVAGCNRPPMGLSYEDLGSGHRYYFVQTSPNMRYFHKRQKKLQDSSGKGGTSREERKEKTASQTSEYDNVNGVFNYSNCAGGSVNV